MTLNSEERNQSFEEFIEEENKLFKVINGNTFEVEEINERGHSLF